MMRLACLLVLLAPLVSAADVGGEYKGQWTSADGNGGGKIRTTIAKNSSSGWDCKLFFTTPNDDTEVSAKTVSCSVDGNKLDAQYEAAADNGTMKINIMGTANGNAMEGTYKVTHPDDTVETGTWKASADH